MPYIRPTLKLPRGESNAELKSKRGFVFKPPLTLIKTREDRSAVLHEQARVTMIYQAVGKKSLQIGFW